MNERIKALLIEGKGQGEIIDVLSTEYPESSAKEYAEAIAKALKAKKALDDLAAAEASAKAQEEAASKAKLEAQAKAQEIESMVQKGVEAALEKIDIPGKLEASKKSVSADQFKSTYIRDMHIARQEGSWQNDMVKMLRHEMNSEYSEARAISKKFLERSALYTDEYKEKVLRGDATTGSYAVPDEFSDMVIVKAQRASNIFENSTKLSMASDKLNLLGAGDVTWTEVTNQDTAATSSEPTLSQTSLDIFDVAAYSTMSQDLIDDSNVNMVSLLSDSYGRGLATYLKLHTTVGSTVTGDKQNGIAFFSGIGSVTAADGVNGIPTWEELMETVSNIDEVFLDGCVWEMNKNYWFNKLAKIKDGDDKPLLVPAMGDWTQYTLGGFPIKWNNAMPSTLDVATSARTGGTDSAILFGNPKEIFMGIKGGMEFMSSSHVGFLKRQETFRGWMRLDWTIVNVDAYARLVMTA